MNDTGLIYDEEIKKMLQLTREKRNSIVFIELPYNLVTPPRMMVYK
jgi:hypothetical protein